MMVWSVVLRNVIEHNRYLVGLNSNALSEFFCLIVTRFFLAVTMRSSLSWKVFMVNRFRLRLRRLEYKLAGISVDNVLEPPLSFPSSA